MKKLSRLVTVMGLVLAIGAAPAMAASPENAYVNAGRSFLRGIASNVELSAENFADSFEAIAENFANQF